MNWKVGFFRLWAATAFLWICLVMSFTFNNVLNPYISPKAVLLPIDFISGAKPNDIEISKSFDKYKTLLSKHISNELIINKYNSKYEAANELTRRGKLIIIFSKDIPDIDFFLPSYFSVEQSNELKILVTERAAEVKNNLISQAKIKSLKTTFLSSVIPPLILLILGIAVSWIANGFKKSM